MEGLRGNKEEERRERGEEERKRGGVKMDGKGQSLYISFIILAWKGKVGGLRGYWKVSGEQGGGWHKRLNPVDLERLLSPLAF